GLKDQGAVKVAAACTHPLLTPGAKEKLMEAGAEVIIGTDTIDSPYCQVTVAGMITDYLKGIL
ncbi:MAG: ribose-phosphate diphosphokinase, partial [Candidatus Thorarchaeota archaeon]